MKSLKLQSPWYTYNSMVKAMFDGDDEVNVGEVVDDVPGYDFYFDLAVKDHKKAQALERILKPEVVFGNIKLGIGVVDESSEADMEPDVGLFITALNGNKNLKDIRESIDAAKQSHAYIRFWPEVIQFYNDDLTDYNGNWNGLAEDIAREIFVNRRWDIQFCTVDKRENEKENEAIK